MRRGSARCAVARRVRPRRAARSVCSCYSGIAQAAVRRATVAAKSRKAAVITTDSSAWHVRQAPAARMRRCSSALNGRTSSRVATCPVRVCRNPVHASAGSPSWGDAGNAGVNCQRPRPGAVTSYRSSPRPKPSATGSRWQERQERDSRAMVCAARCAYSRWKMGSGAAPARRLRSRLEDHPGHEGVDHAVQPRRIRRIETHTQRGRRGLEGAGLFNPGALHVALAR